MRRLKDKFQHPDVELKQKLVVASMVKMLQHSERDTHAIEQLEEIGRNADSVGKQKISVLISDFKRVSYNTNWIEFECLFENANNLFYEKLRASFSNLTNKELILCAFLRLSLNSKELAQITLRSDEALKKARLRLRQKFGISRDVNLTTFLQNF